MLVSFKSCCCFTLIFLLLLVIAFGILTLIVIFFLRPQEPKFCVSTMKVDSYKLSVYSSSSLLVSSVVSLILNAQNRNKVGIKYSSSWLNLYYHGFPVGVVKIPGFYQPANSENTAVKAQISLHCLNVTQMMSEGFSESKASKKASTLKILGDIRVQLLLFHGLTLPKIKVELQCDIDFNYKEFPFKFFDFSDMDVFQDHLASIPVNSKTFSKKCALSMHL